MTTTTLRTPTAPNRASSLRYAFAALFAAFTLLLATAPSARAGDIAPTVSTYYSHSLFLTADGTLWATGYNNSGGLGDGTTTHRNTPVQVSTPNGFAIIAIAAGGGHSLFLTADGKLWGMGANKGQLGDGTDTPRSIPVPVLVPDELEVTAIAAGNSHSLFVTKDGRLWAMGLSLSPFGSGNGGIGNSTPEQVTVPENPDLKVTTTIAAGTLLSHFVTEDDRLWGRGFNSHGELGDGTTINRNTPVQITIPGYPDLKVTAVAAGHLGCLFLAENGTLWATGLNGFGQLGDGTTTDHSTPVQVTAPGYPDLKIITMAAGIGQSLFVTEDGRLWAMGSNSHGQLGNGTDTNQLTPVRVLVPGDRKVTAVAAGDAHSLFVTEDGKFWAMGNNSYGQLGDGTNVDSNLPVQVLIPVAPDIATQPESKTVAAGESATFSVVTTGTAPLSYQWYFNGDVIVGADAASYTTAIVGSYTVEISNDMGTVTSDAAVLTWEIWDIAGIAAKGIKLTAPKTLVVPKEGAKLDKGTKAVYVWTDADGHILNKLDKAGNPISAKTYTAKTDGTYTVELWFSATDKAGNVLTAPAPVPLGKVKLFVPPKLAKVGSFVAEQLTTQTGVANSVASGETLKLTVTLDAAVTPPVNYIWYKNGKLWGAPTSNSASLTDSRTTDAFGAKADSYSVVVETVARDAKGVKPLASVKSKAIKPKVILKPTVSITTAPAKLSVVEGKSVTLKAKATGTAKLIYTWFKGSNPVPLQTGTKSSFKISKTSVADSGIYHVEVTNAAGFATTSAVVTVTAPAAP